MKWRFASIDDASVKEASGRAFSGRLSFRESDKGVSVDYCTGQYWPTEYRKAALCVLRDAIRISESKGAAK